MWEYNISDFFPSTCAISTYLLEIAWRNYTAVRGDLSKSTLSIKILVWVLRGFCVIRLVTSKCLVDSFSLHNRVEKKHRCQNLCRLVTLYDAIGCERNKKNFRKRRQIIHHWKL